MLSLDYAPKGHTLTKIPQMSKATNQELVGILHNDVISVICIKYSEAVISLDSYSSGMVVNTT